MKTLKKGDRNNAVKQLQQTLNTHGFNLKTDGIFGPKTHQAVVLFQTRHHLTPDGIVGPITYAALHSEQTPLLPKEGPGVVVDLSKEGPGVVLLAKPTLQAILPNASTYKINLFHTPINHTLTKYNINRPLRIAHWIAQVAHESGSLHYMQELASGAAYEGRTDLGNTKPGDGILFKGRGLIQLTGRANYKTYGKYISQNLTTGNNMHLVATPRYAADVAGWYWQTRNLNWYADRDDLEKITRKINGGLNGLEDRRKHLHHAKQILKLL